MGSRVPLQNIPTKAQREHTSHLRTWTRLTPPSPTDLRPLMQFQGMELGCGPLFFDVDTYLTQTPSRHAE